MDYRFQMTCTVPTPYKLDKTDWLLFVSVKGWLNLFYLEGLKRAVGEVQETQHSLDAAFEKGYLDRTKFDELDTRYTECIKMLLGLRKALLKDHR